MMSRDLTNTDAYRFFLIFLCFGINIQWLTSVSSLFITKNVGSAMQVVVAKFAFCKSSTRARARWEKGIFERFLIGFFGKEMFIEKFLEASIE